MNEGQIVSVNITDEIKTSFLNYAMSVIVDRALPDVRDGLKPVQRRILYAMHQEGLTSSHRHAKSAAVVGEVMKKYHPHGDASIYDATVRMAQSWNMRYTLVDGQGNFGSIDGDPPAAPRYTEARMTPLADSLLLDLGKESVDFKANYDDTTTEPEVLPAAVPNMLINGASGIAVGMATNIPPYNLGEIIDGLMEMIDKPDIDIEGLMVYIKGPDFPTGAMMGRQGIRKALETGRGGLRLRAKARFEERNNRESIVVTEIPYQVNKATLIQNAAQLVRNKRIEDIADIRDESDRQGMRIVFDLKRGANGELVLNQLYKYTTLQTSFNVNNLAIVNKSPRLLSLVETLKLFLSHRREVVERRCRYELRKAKERAHALEGYLIALKRLDEVIALIRASKDGPEARQGLIATFGLSEAQAQAVLDLRLQRFTGLEQGKITEEYQEIQKNITHLEYILSNEPELWKVIKTELRDIRSKFADKRRTQITDLSDDINKEDLIAEETVVVTLTRGGYIKRTPLANYRAQLRGGRGARAQKQKEDDINSEFIVGSTHNYLLFFTDRGRVYREKIYDLPEADRNAKGSHLRNILPLEGNEQVYAVLPIKDFNAEGSFIFATRKGMIKKTAIRTYSNINTSGIIAINLKEGDELVAVNIAKGDSHIVLATKEGKAIRFHETDVRSTGRSSQGVKGIKLRTGDVVVSLAVIDASQLEKAQLLAVSEHGYGKQTLMTEYSTQNRGGFGVITLKVTPRTGNLVSLSDVQGDEELLVLSEGGVLIRTKVKEISSYGRSSQGVTIMRLDDKDKVVAAMVMMPDESVLEEEGEEEASAVEVETNAVVMPEGVFEGEPTMELETAAVETPDDVLEQPTITEVTEE